MPQSYPRAAVSTVLVRGSEVLLVRRAKGAYRGVWSLPGGAIELGESAAGAARRELREETGLLASSLVLGDVADAIVKDSAGAVKAHYTIAVYATDRVTGTLSASGDATDAGWFGPAARARLPCTPGLEVAIERARLALDKGTR